MKKMTLMFVAALAAVLTGCIPSVNPFYTEQDVSFDPRLVGLWQKSGEQETWQFEKEGEKAYKLTLTDKDRRRGVLKARLFKQSDDLYLDVTPTDCEFASDQADIIGACMMPGHLLIRVAQVEPTLKLAFFDFDWLAKHLEKDPGALAHHAEEKRLLLTASTRELQQFVARHRAEGELFQKPEELVRQASPAQK